MALTDKEIRALKPKPNKQYTVSGLGERGLSVVVSYGGAKVFYYRYTTHEGKQSRIKLGSYPALSLSNATKRAREFRVNVDKGDDPARDKQKQRLEVRQQQIKTVNDLWNDYRRRVGDNKRSADFELSIWRTHLEKVFSSLDVRDFSRSAIMHFLDEIRLSKSPALANRTQALLTRLAKHGMDRRIFDMNPAHDLGKKPKENSRKRTLSKTELQDFWDYLHDYKLLNKATVSPLVAQALKLITLTLCRRAEVAGAKWNEIDKAAHTWTIPAERVKNNRDHVIPLSAQSLEVLKLAKEYASKDSEYIFPSPRTNLGVRPDALTKACRRICEALERAAKAQGVGFEHYRPHDLRRTGATILTSEVLGASRFIVSQVLNHAKDTGGVAAIFGTYDRNDYLKEKRLTLNAWGGYVGSGTKDNVIVLAHAMPH